MVGTYALSLLWPWGSVPGRGTKIPQTVRPKKVCLFVCLFKLKKNSSESMIKGDATGKKANSQRI